MSRITSKETGRDILSLLGRVALRLAQATGVTVGVFATFSGAYFGRTRCTKEGAYQAAMKSDLRNLVAEQEVYFQEHRGYAPSMEAFGDDRYRTSAGVSMVLGEATATGWRAYATHSRTTRLCAIFVGDVAPPVKHAVEAEPRCWDP